MVVVVVIEVAVAARWWQTVLEWLRWRHVWWLWRDDGGRGYGAK